jgi:hypothetical protein
MDLATIIVGIVIVVLGVRQETSGAGLPLIVAGACMALFGMVWFLGNHFNWY